MSRFQSPTSARRFRRTPFTQLIGSPPTPNSAGRAPLRSSPNLRDPIVKELFAPESPPARTPSHPHGLSPREVEIRRTTRVLVPGDEPQDRPQTARKPTMPRQSSSSAQRPDTAREFSSPRRPDARKDYIDYNPVKSAHLSGSGLMPSPRQKGRVPAAPSAKLDERSSRAVLRQGKEQMLDLLECEEPSRALATVGSKGVADWLHACIPPPENEMVHGDEGWVAINDGERCEAVRGGEWCKVVCGEEPW
ncbi:hypothetical protein CYMTET_5721 [Cymbomonas tetramitiformis]|uniref:Uncharacterized protein n=1 Tax=Cymbomonas tetramitiformis TaxID=36881 RepID=A0AAE0GYV5_9CHLO|nr:hypothetical protein CYMTET_5721 [Cymbomonas tetramitiformis]